jgi:hypothetical protein
MNQKYCRLRVRIAGSERVSLEIRDWDDKQKEYAGDLGYKDENRSRILELHHAARKGELSGPGVEELGKRLFSVLFAERLRREFLEIYRKAGNENAMLRLELEVDEVGYPEIASLPWEFMYAPPEADGGGIWLATAPNMVFSRRRVEGEISDAIKLAKGERLRIALAVSAPEGLGKVQYDAVADVLKELSLSQGFDFLDIICPASQVEIDKVLEEKKPHIFHFIGHSRLIKDENGKEKGQLALTGPAGFVDWVSADVFSERFHRHQPGLVVLQSCESGALSSSEALVGIASKVVQKYIPAVVAMQYKVSNATAKRFALEFYRRLAKYEPVDKAIQESRLKIALRPGGGASRDFATPVLFMQVKEERLFQRHPDDIVEVAKKSQNDYEIDIKSLMAKLTFRLDDIGMQLFTDVTNLLYKIGSKGPDEDGKKYIQLIREFISKTLTVEEFEQQWDKYREKSHLEQVEKGPDYEILADRLNRGKIIPFLGSDVLLLSGFPVPSSPDIVGKMAKRVGCPDFSGTLSMLFQYCESKKKWDRGRIIKEFREMMMEERQKGLSNSLYELLAKIKSAVLVISSSYDDLLEHAFREKGKRFLVLSHYFQTTSDIADGKILLQYDHKTEPEKPCLAKDLPDLEEETKKGYSIIYKICGYFRVKDPLTPDENEETTPLMIMENDFFAFSRKLEYLIPLYITTRFSDLGFLFLGYNLHEWQDRLIADSLLEKCPKKVDSFTVCENLTPYEWAFWKSTHKLITYREELKDFVHRLYGHI